MLTLRCSRWLSPAGLDLAERLLSYDPAQRVTAVDALEAPYFRQENPPAALPVGYVVDICFEYIVMLMKNNVDYQLWRASGTNWKQSARGPRSGGKLSLLCRRIT